MGTVRRQFTDEFKREAVGLLASSGRPSRVCMLTLVRVRGGAKVGQVAAAFCGCVAE